MSAVCKWSDPVAEERLRAAVTLDEPWALIERFSTLVRESGSEDEREAARYIIERLQAYGVFYTLYEPELFLSVPKAAKLVAYTPAGRKEIRCKTPSFSARTGDIPLMGELVYLPTGHAKDVLDLFEGDVHAGNEITGKIVLTEGYPMPAKVQAFSERGVAGAIFIAPGAYIHEGICTPIWGAPDLDNYGRQPRIPVIAINAMDGEWLVQQCKEGKVRVELNTWLDEGWKPCPLIEAVIPGQEEPDKFVLLHGHIDSWHVGIGDNATGDAALLEIARVLHAHRELLKRTVKICWWPGHSTGRYAGSTWYADTFALDIEANCVAHINCDSPGCRDATSFEDLTCMPEAEEVAGGAIRDVSGLEAEYAWPPRAGDISFNNLGVSTFYMLSSTIPAEQLKQKGYYAVGGCGGNIEWHTEDDTIDIADRELLLRDIRIYLTATFRVANAPVVPLDYRRTVDALVNHLKQYAQAAGGRVSFESAFKAAAEARKALDVLYARAEELVASGRDVSDAEVREINATLLRVGRLLVSLGFSERGRFRHDPALPIPPIPEVAPALRFKDLPLGSHLERVTRVHVKRGLNRVAWTFSEVAREVSRTLVRSTVRTA